MEDFFALKRTHVRAFGYEKASFLRLLEVRIEQKKRNPDTHMHTFREGRWWVYNTMANWIEELCLNCSGKTLRKWIKELENDKLIVADSFNALPGDNTLWFSPDEKAIEQYVKRHEEMRQAKKKRTQAKKREPLEIISRPLEETSTPPGKNFQTPLEETSTPPGKNFQSNTQDFNQEISIPEISTQTTHAPAAIGQGEESIFEQLLKLGIDQLTAEQWLCKYGSAFVKRQLDWLPYRNAKEPAAYLNTALRRNLAEPAALKALRENGANQPRAPVETVDNRTWAQRQHAEKMRLFDEEVARRQSERAKQAQEVTISVTAN